MNSLNRKSKYIAAGLLMILLGTLLLGCQGANSIHLPLDIVGDIANPLRIDSLSQAPATQKLKHRGKTIVAASLKELIQEAEPFGEQFNVLFIAGDGFSALIDNGNLDESYLALNQQNGWEAINLRHPVSSNIKNIQEIIIVAQGMPVDNYFNIIEPGRNITRLSVGELYSGGYSVFSTTRGTATVEHDGQELTATTFYRHKAFAVEDYVDLVGRDSALVIGEKGEIERLRQDGRFVLASNSVSYMVGDELTIPRAKGIVLDPPGKKVTDVYGDARVAMAEGVPLLLILVDGLGQHQYQHASAQGYTPFLDSLPQPRLSMSVYPSITPVNLAASLSGALPHVSGVYERRTRQLNVPTLFALSKDEGKKMTAIFGPLGTIELEIEPVFNVDRNGDGSTDDEKTASALKIIAEKHDLLFVHYKDVDIAGHDNGDLHEDTLAKIRQSDDYIRRLVEKWEGRVLIYADHGMYPEGTGGAHGALVAESMFTLYWLFDTEKE